MKAVIILAGLALLGCTTRDQLEIRVAAQNGQCTAQIEGRFVAAEAIGDLIKARRTNPDIAILGDENTPYRCIGALIYYSQAAGARRVRFGAPDAIPR